MGNPDTLSDFIEFGLETYPSLYNALVLWNHGGGAKSINFDILQSREICQDLTSGDILNNNEVQQGIKAGLAAAASVAAFDVLGMDACLMGTVETAYELRELGSYFTASPAEEWIWGWDYQRLFGNFSVSGSIPLPSAMADMIVTQYKQSTDTESTSLPNTMTAVDLSMMSALKTEIDKLAVLLYGAGESSFEARRDASGYFYDLDPSDTSLYAPYTDLYSFCKGVTGDAAGAASSVLTALDSAVVGCYAESSGIGLDDYYGTADEDALRGLSIFISHGEKTYLSKSHYAYHYWYYDDDVTGSDNITVGSLDFCTSDTDGTVESWRELFEAWYDDYPSDGYTLGKY
ncbi:MAG: hypothetical protein JEZ04_04115 [Spirochaetales bacterium]|nr:hypothetical protein [Spirochaetales bacterium]